MAFASLAVIFEHTNDLNGWEPAQLVALLGVYFLMSGVIGTLIQPNMERLMEGVQSGTLDFTLTKPDDAQLLISIGEIRVWRLIDVFQGSIVLFAAIWHLGGENSLLFSRISFEIDSKLFLLIIFLSSGFKYFKGSASIAEVAVLA